MPSGGCLCGNVKYSYTQAKMKALCHCLTCRKITGSTYATTMLVAEEDFTFKPISTVKPRQSSTTHESGMGLTFYGCPDCPSLLYKTATGFPGHVIIFAGTLDGKDEGGVEGEGVGDEGKPGAELWTKYRVPWQREVEGAHQFEGFPDH